VTFRWSGYRQPHPRHRSLCRIEASKDEQDLLDSNWARIFGTEINRGRFRFGQGSVGDSLLLIQPGFQGADPRSASLVNLCDLTHSARLILAHFTHGSVAFDQQIDNHLLQLEILSPRMS